MCSEIMLGIWRPARHCYTLVAIMKNDRIDILENKPVNTAIIMLALPTMLASAVQLIYNLTDAFFIGMTGNPYLVAAISLAVPVFFTGQAIGNIFANGTASYVSRRLGAKDYTEAKHSSAVAVYSAIVVGAVFAAIILLFREPILHTIGTSDATFSHTLDYLSIIVMFAPMLILQITLGGLIRSEGATQKAMIGMVIGIGLNIILDPIFILKLDMGVAGAAWATVLGNAFGLLYYLSHLLSKNTLLSIKPKDFRPSRRIYFETFKIGVPSALSMFVMSLSMVLTNIIAASYGDHIVAGFGIEMRVASIAFTLIFGLALGFQPFAGYNYGAHKYGRLHDGFRITMLYSVSLATLSALIFALFGENLVGIFIDDEATVTSGWHMLRAFAWAVPFIGVQVTMLVTFQATGKAIKAMILSLGRQFLVYLPLLFVLNSMYGLSGFIYAQPIADILTTAIAVLFSLSFMKELRLLESKENTHDPQFAV